MHQRPGVRGPTASQLRAVETAVNALRTSFKEALDALAEACDVFPQPDRARNVLVPAHHKTAAAGYATLLRRFPYVASSIDPDVIDAGLAVDNAFALLRTDLQTVSPMTVYFGRQAAHISWSDATVVRLAAKAQESLDHALATAVSAVEEGLRLGKRVSTTADAAANAKAKVAKVQKRAAVVEGRAVATAMRAERSAARAAQAHADNHPQSAVPAPPPAQATDPVATDPKKKLTS